MANDFRARLFGEGPSQRQRRQVQRIFEFLEAWNARDLKNLREYFAEKHIDRTFFGHQPIDRDSKMRMFAGMFEAFPDWYETVDELVPTERNKIAIRHTGRGTQAKTFMGRAATGRQLASTYIDLVAFDEDDRIVEYSTGQFPFTAFWDEPIVAAEDVMEVRAEQGGTTISHAQRREIQAALVDTTLDYNELGLAKTVAQPVRRCEALLEDNLRRCLNQASEGSNFCDVHRVAGWGPTSLREFGLP